MVRNPPPAFLSTAALLILIGFAVVLHLPVLNLRSLMPKDDWKPVKSTLARPLHPQIEAHIRDFGLLNLRWEWELGRFTPLYNAVQVAEARILRDSPSLWQAETLGVGIAAAFLFYAVLIRLGFSFFPALLGSLWFLGRGQDLWVEKQYQEEPGMLFLMLALFCFIQGARGHRGAAPDWAAVGFMALAGLTKETFVFLFPSLVVFRIFLSSSLFDARSTARIFRDLRGPLATAGALFILQMGVIAYVFHEGPYARSLVGNPFSLSLSGIGGLLQGVAPHLAYFLPALGSLLLIPRLGGRGQNRGTCGGVVVILLLWIGPQILIYRNSGWYGHYIYPALVGLILVNILGLEALRSARRTSARLLFAALTLFCMLGIVLRAPATRNLAESKAAEARAFAAASGLSFRAARPQSAVLLASDRPWWGLGITYLMDLSRMGLECPVYYDYPAFDAGKAGHAGRTAIGTGLIERYLRRLSADAAGGIDILLSVYPEKESLRIFRLRYAWFDPGDWTVHAFPVPYAHFRFSGLVPRALSRIEQRKIYTVWVRRE